MENQPCTVKMEYLVNCKPESSKVCSSLADLCFPAVKLVHIHGNHYFDWLISVQQSDSPVRLENSIPSGKYKGLRLSIQCNYIPIN